MIIDFSKFKSNKRAKVIEEDLINISKILSLTFTALSFYKKYRPVSELLAEIASKKLDVRTALQKIQEQKD